MSPNAMKKMSSKLKELYASAPWTEIENDVSLCVWVRRMTGTELTLKQVEKLREFLDKEHKREPNPKS